MASMRTYMRSFSGGEMSPEMFGRIDEASFQTGAAKIRNFIVGPQGPVFRRPGTTFIRQAKTGTPKLIDFTFGESQDMCVEMGDGYFRFHSNASTLLARNRVPSQVVTLDVVSDQIAWPVAHTLQANDPVQLSVSGGGSLAGTGLSTGTTYYVIIVDSVDIKLAATPGGAAIDITGVGVPTITGHFLYQVGDCARLGGVTYYCILEHTGQTPPDIVYWTAVNTDLPYEVPSPYAQNDLFSITTFQSFDVMTLLHKDYAPRELRRLAADRWVLTEIDFEPLLSAPSGLSQTSRRGLTSDITAITGASSPAIVTTANVHNLVPSDVVFITGSGTSFVAPNTLDEHYVVLTVPTANTFTVATVDGGTSVTAVAVPTITSGKVRVISASSRDEETYKVTAIDENGRESQASTAEVVSNVLAVQGASNTITWGAVTGATRYRVYKLQTGLYGFLGQVEAPTVSFTDDNIGPDMAITLPLFDTTLSGTDYPRAGCYFEQRRIFGGTAAFPQDVWMTSAGSESDLTFHIPTLDTDRIRFRVDARQAAPIRHIIPLGHLILLTEAGEFRLTPVNSDAVTPSSISVRPQSYVGASTVQPIVVNNSLVFCAAHGGHVREMGFRADSNGFVTGDLSLRAEHLFTRDSIGPAEIVDAAYGKDPNPVLWFVTTKVDSTSSNALLLGLTYVPEEQIGAWHVHETQGQFRSCCTITEGGESRLYMAVERGVNPATVCIERMSSQVQPGGQEIQNYFGEYLDCVSVYAGSPTLTISGLDHLHDMAVSVRADGVNSTMTVSASGTLTFTTAVSNAIIGLSYTSELQTLPLVMQVDGFGTGRTKNINRAWVRIKDAARFEVGKVDVGFHFELDEPTFPSFTEDAVVNAMVDGDWNDDGQIMIRQTNPYPLTVLGITLHATAGG